MHIWALSTICLFYARKGNLCVLGPFLYSCVPLVFSKPNHLNILQHNNCKLHSAIDAVALLRALERYCSIKSRYFLFMHQLAIGFIFTHSVDKIYMYNVQLNFLNWNTFLRVQVSNDFSWLPQCCAQFRSIKSNRVRAYSTRVKVSQWYVDSHRRIIIIRLWCIHS